MGVHTTFVGSRAVRCFTLSMWSWPFDFAIFIFLIGAGAFLVEVVTDWSRYKNRLFLQGLIVAVLIAWVTVFYGSFIEPKRLILSQQEIHLATEVDQSIRVAVVADFHVGPYRKADWVARVVDAVMQQEPDLILMPGDFIFNDAQQVEYLLPLSGLSAPLGVFAVTGNHDYSHSAEEDVISTLEVAGITVLRDEHVVLPVTDKEFVIAGVSDLWFEGVVSKALENLRDDQTVVLLSHNPDAVLDASSAVADLVVSGHTHGGQIRLPFIGPVPPLPTQLGRSYDQGLFDYTDTQKLFITSGVGETGPRARLFNPPEFSLLTLSF